MQYLTAFRTVQFGAGWLVPLLLLGACSGNDGTTDPPDGPTTGTIAVSATTTGDDQDTNGYSVMLDGTEKAAIGANGSVNVNGVSPGNRSVSLSGVAGNCAVGGEHPLSVSVAAGNTVSVSFDVSCSALTGDLEVNTVTGGGDLDPDGYSIVLDGTGSRAIGVNGTVTFSDLAQGQHQVQLTEFAGNCFVNGDNPRTVAVTAVQTTETTFGVTCTTPLTSRIAFRSNRDGNPVDLAQGTGYDIFVTDADGSNPVNLTNHDANDRGPSWSPDGARIAFTSDRDGYVPGAPCGDCYDIWIMDADGSNLVNLGSQPAWDSQLAWSPDGTQIAFASNRDGNQDDIFVMNADGSNPTNLTNHPDLDWHPTWSPDGTKIAFMTNRDGSWEIYAMNADGSDPVNLTNHDAQDREPSWSPDGTKIAFSSEYREVQADRIYVMGADGSNPTRLTDSYSGSPAWSPDGNHIAFENYGLTIDIYVMEADGSNPVNVTNHPAYDWGPAWSQ